VPSAHAPQGELVKLALIVVYLAAGCGSKVVHRPGEEWLETIKIEGNTSIKTKDLTEGLALQRVKRQGGSPDPYLVVVDGKRIEGEYVRRGFLEVDVRSRVERHGDKTLVTYTVAEGPRAATRVLITGIPKNDPDLTVDTVRNALPIKDGEPFSYLPYDEAKERMLGIIEDAGYAHATLNAHVIADRANHEAVIHLEYHVGPKCKFGSITVTGADGQLADAVRARVAIEPGQVYSAAAIAETQRRIYDMRRFSMVRVLPAKGSTGETIDVTISLARSTRNELVTGGGVGMDPATYEIRARTGYTITGWPFPLTDFSVDLRPAYAMLRDSNEYEPRIRAMAKLRRIDLFRPFIVGEVEGGYNYLTVEAYTSYGPRARLGLQSPLGWKALQARVGWEIESLDFRHISPLIDESLQMELGLDQTQRVGQYTQAISLDLRDNVIEPTLGAYAELRVDEGTPYAGGAMSFLRVTPELRGFLSTPALPVVLAARARYGRIYGDLPATERYFSGGSTTQRGFSERRLAPSLTGEVDGSERTVPYGGAELVETNVELRTRIGKVKGMGVGGVGFLDGGDVVDTDTHVDLSNLHWAAGVGLRLFTLVGAVRADFGYRLNRTGPMDPSPGDKFAFHLSIGEAF
jgi:translocation and assembly module TamA